MSPSLEPIPNGFWAVRGTDEHSQLMDQVRNGELSRATVPSDEIETPDKIRDIFYPTDFDPAYVAIAAMQNLHTIGIDVLDSTEEMPDVCRIADLETYVKSYKANH